MVIFTFIFGRIAKMPSNGIPYPILVFAAMLPWQFFATALAEASASMVANTNLVSKVYFPRLIIPAGAVITSLVDLAVSAGLLVFLSPVGFSIDVIPEEWRLVYSLNPMVGVIDGFRWALCRGGTGDFYMPGFVLSLIVILLFLSIGIWYFRRTEKGFADVI